MTNLSPDIRCSVCDEVFTAEDELLGHNEATHPFDATHQERERQGVDRAENVEGAGAPAEDEPQPDAALHGETTRRTY